MNLLLLLIVVLVKGLNLEPCGGSPPTDVFGWREA